MVWARFLYNQFLFNLKVINRRVKFINKCLQFYSLSDSNNKSVQLPIHNYLILCVIMSKLRALMSLYNTITLSSGRKCLILRLRVGVVRIYISIKTVCTKPSYTQQDDTYRSKSPLEV